MVVIGMISSGKSTFLNSIFGIDYFEANNDTTSNLFVLLDIIQI
jgi:GTPase SAR1 family protein